jgi:hypothetical protein
MKLFLFLTFVANTAAFAPSRNVLKSYSHSHALIRPVTMLNVATPTPVETLSALEKEEPDMIDENVYTFNKILIDTVYNVICFFYPVTGTKRDFARFYVLETVARV